MSVCATVYMGAWLSPPGARVFPSQGWARAPHMTQAFLGQPTVTHDKPLLTSWLHGGRQDVFPSRQGHKERKRDYPQTESEIGQDLATRDTEKTVPWRCQGLVTHGHHASCRGRQECTEGPAPISEGGQEAERGQPQMWR